MSSSQGLSRGHATLDTKCGILIRVAVWTMLLGVVMSIYCDDQNCYDILGVDQSATPKEIKQAYFNLSMIYHPDKNPDPGAGSLFAKIANAYEILKDKEKREQYDYALEHPEQYMYNTARYYQSYYNPKADLRAILIGVLLLLSAFQYLNDWIRYNQAVETAKQTPAYKNRIKAMEAERNGGVVGKKKGTKGRNRGDSSGNLSAQDQPELKIHGAEKPGLWQLVATGFIVLPYTTGKLVYWQLSWVHRYYVSCQPYTYSDAVYLTRTALGLIGGQWLSIDGVEKDRLVNRRLWVPQNLEAFRNESRKERRSRR